MKINKFILLFLLFGLAGPTFAAKAPSQDGGQRIEIPALKEDYPRIFDEEAVRGKAAELDSKLEPYISRHVDEPEWIVSRLQMFWHSRATDIYINGEEFDHEEGCAPVPTVRYSASREGVSNYSRPSLEEVLPYQDSLGLWMINKQTGQAEWADQRKTGGNIESINREIMGLARDAAYLYRLDGDERYARFAADIFDTYMTGLYYRNVPYDLNHGQQQTLVGLTSFEVIHEDIAVDAARCYDCLHDYLAAVHADKIGIYEDAFRKWAQNIVDNGVPHNNWDLIQARFILNIALVLGDDSAYPDGCGRQHFLNQILNESSIRQWSIGKLIDFGFDAGTGLWKESPGYSSMVLWEFMSFASLIKSALGIDLTEIYPILNKAVNALPQYLFPNGLRVCWGDGFYEVPDKTAAWPEGPVEDYVTPTFHSKEVSWFAARSGMDPDKSLMMSVCGSKGNHMHANGISMELYGKGYVQAPDLGRGMGYTTLDHKEFYSQFPAHNTVCVDGVSSYPTMMSQHAFALEGCYPAPENREERYEGVLYGDFSFIEPETQSDQRRQVLIVNTDPENGYYVDVFRSRRQDGTDKMHDYFYHNIGQEFTLNCQMEPTQELAFAGGHIYAYSYLWDKWAAETEGDINGAFTMRLPDGGASGMRMWMRGEKDRTVFKALSPCIDALTRTPMPYDVKNSPCQTFVARQYGEAWTRPFAAVYEPFASSDGADGEEPSPDLSGTERDVVALDGSEDRGETAENIKAETDDKDNAEAVTGESFGAIAGVEWPECDVESGVVLKVTKKDGRQDFIFSADAMKEFSITLPAEFPASQNGDDSAASQPDSSPSETGQNGDASASSPSPTISGIAVLAVVSDDQCFMARGTELAVEFDGNALTQGGGVRISTDEPATVALFLRDGRWHYSSDTPCCISLHGRTYTLPASPASPIK